MRRRTGWLSAGVTLIASAALAAFLVSLRPEPERRPPPSRIPFAATATVRAVEGAIPVHGSGTVRPRAEIDLAAEVGGKVVWVNPAFESGGRMREDQPLFRIEDADYRNAIEQARADVAFQEVELLKVREEAEVARTEYEDFKRRQAGEDASSEAGPLALWKPQLAAAQAGVARAAARLAAAELNLARTEVKAPFAGVVRSESVHIGEFVAAGQSVGRLYPSDAVEVVVPLSDADVALLPALWDLRAGDGDRRIGVRVIAAYGDDRYAWSGYVDRAEAALDEQTRTLDVIVRVPMPFRGGVPEAGGAEAVSEGGPPLLVGKFADVEFEGIAPDTYYEVRRPALRPGNEVWAVRGDRLRIVPVEMLQRLDDDIYVTGDLEAGEQVVVGGIQVGTDGMEVRTASAQPD